MTTKYAKARNQAHQFRAHLRRSRAKVAALEAERAAKPAPSAELIDHHLDQILKASGSALKHYTMAKPKDDMRAALRAAIKAFTG